MATEDKIKKLINLYESIIHGDKENWGLFSCYDTYYKGCWDDRLNEIEEIKKELNLNIGDKIEKILKEWEWYSKSTAFDSQRKLMNSFKEQYNKKGHLTNKQVEVAEDILEQNKHFTSKYEELHGEDDYNW